MSLTFFLSQSYSQSSLPVVTRQTDPNKVAVSIIETDHGEMVERLFYDKKEYDCEYDWCDSRGKGYYAGVAWFNKRWEDPCLNEDTDKEAWDDAWEWYDSELAEKEAAE